MKVRSQTYWLPKRGNSNEEYEDAAWPMEATESDSSEFKCAVADGATEASFSSRWAQLLVKGFTEETDLTELAERWAEEIKQLELPWYAQEKAESGAYATLSCLKLADGGTYRARVLGDSCILHIRNDELVEAFPLSEYESFDNSPVLLCSKLDSHEDVESLFTVKEGDWKGGDRFLLLTDAIAAWIFKRHESRGDRIKILLGISDQEQLASLCNDARDQHDDQGRPEMRNDDVTLLNVEVST